jgi:hypothetical protein
MDSEIVTPADMFQRAFDELVRGYDGWRFFCERDIEWTLQRTLWRDIDRLALPLAAFNQYPILPGQHLDLALTRPSLLGAAFGATSSSAIPVGVELKYEPSHARRDIAPSKFDVCDYNAVMRDVDRITAWLDGGRIDEGFAVFIDEGGRFSHRPAHPRGEWRTVTTGGGSNIHVHWAHGTSPKSAPARDGTSVLTPPPGPIAP